MAKPDWRLLHESDCKKLDRLLSIYKQNPAHAKVMCVLEGKPVHTRIVLFEKPDGSFSFVKALKTTGISSTNRMYSSSKTIMSIVYKAENKSFWFGWNGRVRQLNAGCFTFWESPNTEPEIKEYLFKRFGWMRLFFEDARFLHEPFTTVMRNQRFTPRKILAQRYGTPYEVALLLEASINFQVRNRKSWWFTVRKYLTNLQALTPQFLQHRFFDDTLRLAIATNNKINCKWSEKRLTQEHNAWNKIAIEVFLKYHVREPLRVKPIHYKFEEQTGWELIKDTGRLIAEGKTLAHCVGTYAQRVNDQGDGIFHIEGCTLQLLYGGYKSGFDGDNHFLYNYDTVVIGQFYGFGNSQPPDELKAEVQRQVHIFNGESELEEINKYLQDDGKMDAFLEGKVVLMTKITQRFEDLPITNPCVEIPMVAARLPEEPEWAVDTPF